MVFPWFSYGLPGRRPATRVLHLTLRLAAQGPRPQPLQAAPERRLPRPRAAVAGRTVAAPGAGKTAATGVPKGAIG